MKVKTIITEDGTRADKSEYPIKAVREIILNASL
jgi:ATP-dependent DNA helicase RecG